LKFFRSFKTCPSDPKQPFRSGSGRRILQDQTLLSTPSKQPDEKLSSHSIRVLSKHRFEVAHSTPFRWTVKPYFQANLLINKRFRMSVLPCESANYRDLSERVKPLFSIHAKKPGPQ
jgi:hypothetical protein